MDKRFAFFALSFALTLFLLQSVTGVLLAACIAAVASAGLSAFLLAYKKKVQVIFLLCGTAVAFLLFWIFPKFDVLPKFSDNDMLFTATVIDYSYENNMKTGIVCDVEVTSLNTAELDNEYTSRMYIKEIDVSLTPGDTISGIARFEVPADNEEFNSHTYYKTRGIDTVSFCNSSLVAHVDGRISFRFIPKWIAHNVKLKLRELLPDRLAGFVSAILLGDKTNFVSRDQNNFSAIGLSHVVAVSGMHLSFLAGFFFTLFGKRRRVVFVAIPVLLMFTLIVGSPPSVVRAMIMHTIMLLAPVLMGEADSVNSLSIAAVLILLFNPYAVKDVGFQLSFLATLGIVLFGNKLDNAIKRPFKFKNKIMSRISNFISATLATSLSAIIFTTPIIVWNFGTISLVAPSSNVLLVWIINIVFILSILLVILAFIYMPFAKIVAYPVAFVAQFILEAAALINLLPFSEVTIERSYHVVFLVYVYVVLILFAIDSKRRISILTVSAVVVTAAFTIVGLMQDDAEKYQGARFAVLDVGQGMSVLADYNGFAVLVDCGGSRGDNAGEIVIDYMKKSDIDNIDAFVISHFDSAHINGAKTLIESGNVETLFLPENAIKDEKAQFVLDAANEYELDINYINSETTVSENGLDFTLYPTGSYSDSKENGLVTILREGDFEVVVTGDVSRKSERALCDNHKLPDAEVYVVGNHGSKSSSSFEFLNTILPEFAIISVGADNYYDCPDEETILLFEDMGIKTARTDQIGDVIFYSDELIKGAA